MIERFKRYCCLLHDIRYLILTRVKGSGDPFQYPEVCFQSARVLSIAVQTTNGASVPSRRFLLRTQFHCSKTVLQEIAASTVLNQIQETKVELNQAISFYSRPQCDMYSIQKLRFAVANDEVCCTLTETVFSTLALLCPPIVCLVHGLSCFLAPMECLYPYDIRRIECLAPVVGRARRRGAWRKLAFTAAMSILMSMPPSSICVKNSVYQSSICVVNADSRP